MDQREFKNPINVDRMCASCSKMVFILVERDDFYKYENGTNIQTAFPYLNEDERCILIDGICGECWDKLINSGAHPREHWEVSNG